MVDLSIVMLVCLQNQMIYSYWPIRILACQGPARGNCSIIPQSRPASIYHAWSKPHLSLWMAEIHSSYLQNSQRPGYWTLHDITVAPTGTPKSAIRAVDVLGPVGGFLFQCGVPQVMHFLEHMASYWSHGAMGDPKIFRHRCKWTAAYGISHFQAESSRG